MCFPDRCWHKTFGYLTWRIKCCLSTFSPHILYDKCFLYLAEHQPPPLFLLLAGLNLGKTDTFSFVLFKKIQAKGTAAAVCCLGQLLRSAVLRPVSCLNPNWIPLDQVNTLSIQYPLKIQYFNATCFQLLVGVTLHANLLHASLLLVLDAQNPAHYSKHDANISLHHGILCHLPCRKETETILSSNSWTLRKLFTISSGAGSLGCVQYRAVSRASS